VALPITPSLPRRIATVILQREQTMILLDEV
jgi:hypothetical protein